MASRPTGFMLDWRWSDGLGVLEQTDAVNMSTNVRRKP